MFFAFPACCVVLFQGAVLLCAVLWWCFSVCVCVCVCLRAFRVRVRVCSGCVFVFACVQGACSRVFRVRVCVCVRVRVRGVVVCLVC